MQPLELRCIYDRHVATITRETARLSVGMSQTPSYQNLKKFGHQLLVPLLEDISDPDMVVGWWQLQMTWELAAEQNTPIEFSDAVRGRYELVRQAITTWGREQGYLAVEPAS
jgi:hypothetical protein